MPDSPSSVNHHAPRLRLPSLLLLVMAAILLAPAPAAAQSQGDLRRDNERLRQEVLELRAEILRLRTQVTEAEATTAELLEEIAELRAAADADAPETGEGTGDSSSTDGEDAPVITVDETKPEASPRAIRSEALRRWTAGPGTLDVGVDSASPKRINYLRSLQTWTREQERTWRLKVEWRVRPTGPGREDRGGTSWMMQAHDPVSDAPIGRPFEVRARRAVVRAMDREVLRAQSEGRPADALIVSGDVVFRFLIDPSRREPGTFDRPPLLAPFVTFEFGVDARSLAPPRVTADPAPEDGSTGTGEAPDEDPDEDPDENQDPADGSAGG